MESVALGAAARPGLRPPPGFEAVSRELPGVSCTLAGAEAHPWGAAISVAVSMIRDELGR